MLPSQSLRIPRQSRAFPLTHQRFLLLFLLFTHLFAVALACECFLHASLFARLQIEGVAFDLFDNVFRLHLTLEPAKSILQRLAFLYANFCHD